MNVTLGQTVIYTDNERKAKAAIVSGLSSQEPGRVHLHILSLGREALYRRTDVRPRSQVGEWTTGAFFETLEEYAERQAAEDRAAHAASVASAAASIASGTDATRPHKVENAASSPY